MIKIISYFYDKIKSKLENFKILAMDLIRKARKVIILQTV